MATLVSPSDTEAAARTLSAPPTSLRRGIALRAAGRIAITLVVLAGAWWFLAPAELGGSTAFMTVDGTSMLPRLKPSELVLLRQARRYRVGDVVGYRSTLLGSRRPAPHRLRPRGPLRVQGRQQLVPRSRPPDSRAARRQALVPPALAGRAVERPPHSVGRGRARRAARSRTRFGRRRLRGSRTISGRHSSGPRPFRSSALILRRLRSLRRVRRGSRSRRGRARRRQRRARIAGGEVDDGDHRGPLKPSAAPRSP